MPVDLTVTPAVIPFRDKTAEYPRRVGKWIGPASYPTGGEVVNIPNSFGLGRLMVLLLQPFTNGTVIILGCYVPTGGSVTAGTIKYFDMAGAEIANGTNLSAYTAYFEALGR